MTPAERLREAARVLREARTDSVGLEPALADWLDLTAADGPVCSPTHPALRVADAVLGEP